MSKLTFTNRHSLTFSTAIVLTNSYSIKKSYHIFFLQIENSPTDTTIFQCVCLRNDGGHSRDPDLECVKHDNLLITGVFHSWLGSHLESFGICNQVFLSGRSGSVHKLRTLGWHLWRNSFAFIRENPSSCQRSLWMTPRSSDQSQVGLNTENASIRLI